ncbi:hypothetical protein CYMTET_2787 [Cymbomonas tetramitiformis]|uniref:Uncharacterized protein n=1 Tax=Cymbomonas tetramitiformis TaxID=36881 RepID=A0AAE0CER6_9CHLO|nr:hypothetical protein CYMTET_37820 [Cymbomonas tetramitiformis]KAK3289793.1 hypothetical protein CYMTET_2787 [Cymbomonas tetramitiformis]
MAVPAPTMAAALCAWAATGYFFYEMTRNKKVFGGSIPSTLNDEWAAATKAYLADHPREGSPDNIKLNPIGTQ